MISGCHTMLLTIFKLLPKKVTWNKTHVFVILSKSLHRIFYGTENKCFHPFWATPYMAYSWEIYVRTSKTVSQVCQSLTVPCSAFQTIYKRMPLSEARIEWATGELHQPYQNDPPSPRRETHPAPSLRRPLGKQKMVHTYWNVCTYMPTSTPQIGSRILQMHSMAKHRYVHRYYRGLRPASLASSRQK